MPTADLTAAVARAANGAAIGAAAPALLAFISALTDGAAGRIIEAGEAAEAASLAASNSLSVGDGASDLTHGDEHARRMADQVHESKFSIKASGSLIERVEDEEMRADDIRRSRGALE
jgi:hypothetical protein